MTVILFEHSGGRGAGDGGGGGGSATAAYSPPLPPPPKKKQSWSKEKGEGGPALRPRLLFCVYQSLRGTDAIFNSKSQPCLTGPSLLMPFALIIWAGCSVGKVAAILRVAK